MNVKMSAASSLNIPTSSYPNLSNEIVEETKRALAVEVLRLTGVMRVRAFGASMLPTLWPGDILTVHCVQPDEVSLGDLVLVARKGRFYVHRVVKPSAPLPMGQDQVAVATRGDCLVNDDPQEGELLGRVTEIRRGDVVTRPRRQRSVWNLFVAGMLYRSNLLHRVALRMHSRLRRNDSELYLSLHPAS